MAAGRTVEWTHKGKKVSTLDDIPEGVEHFVYLITDINGRKYVGKKQIMSTRKVEISEKAYRKLKKEGEAVTKTKNKAKSKKGNIVWRFKKIVVKGNKWEGYTGSCIPLNKEIKKGMSYKKEILYFCRTKKQATYFELKEQFTRGVIENDLYWNKNILNKFFKKDLK
jgi:hypothetical protein